MRTKREGCELISSPSYALRYHSRHLGTAEEKNIHTTQKKAPGKFTALKIGKDLVMNFIMADGILSGIAPSVELQT